MKKFSLLICALMASVALYAQNGHLVLSTPEVDVEYQIMSMSPNGKWACGTINDGNYRGFLWNLTSGEIVETSAAGDISIALSVDDSGTIAGTFTTTEGTPNNTPMETYGLYQNGKWTELALTNEKTGVTIARDGYANAISRDGKTIGGIARYGKNYVPVVWRNGELQVIDDVTGAIYDVSADGKTVCGWTLHPQKNNRTCAIWTTVETLYDTKIYTDTLSAYSAGPFCVAKKISPNGRYVAAYDRIYDLETGTSVEIDLYGAIGGFEFHGVTNTGKMFGYYDSGSGRQAVWFDQEGNMQILSEYLKDNGVDLSKYPLLLMLTSVSEDEKTFGVIAYDSKGVPRSLVFKLGIDTDHMAPTVLKTRLLEGVRSCKLTWDAPLKNAEKVKGYHVYRNGSKVNASMLTVREYIDASLELGDYNYVVTAVYEDAESEASESATIQIKDNHPYASPTQVMAVASGVNHARLLWDAPNSNKPSLSYYSPDDNVIGFGGGEFSFEGAIKLRKEELALYKSQGYKISEISFVPMAHQTSWTVNFYVEGKATPIYSEVIPADQLKYGVPNRFQLSTPIDIPAGKSLTMGVAVDVTNYGGYKVLGIVTRQADVAHSDLLRQVGQDEFFSLYEAGLSSSGGSYIYNVCWAMNVFFSKEGEHVFNGPESYNVYVDGSKLENTQETQVRITSLSDGVHTFDVEAVYADNKLSEKVHTTLDVVKNLSVYKGIKPTLKIHGGDVEVTWTAPADNDEHHITYANDDNNGGVVGSADDQYSYMAASIYAGDKLAAFNDYLITGFRFYPLADADFTFILKVDGEEVLNVPLERSTDYTIGKWNTIALEQPIVVNKYSEYMLILDCYDVTPECAPLGLDTQVAYVSMSDLYSTDDGENFRSLTLQGGKEGNWMMGMEVTAPMVYPLPIEGYKVYLDNQVQHEQLLTETHFSLKGLSEGAHQLRVNPCYADGIGEKRSSSVTFVINLVGIDDLQDCGMQIHKGANSVVVEGGEVLGMSVYTLGGVKVDEVNSNTINVSHWPNGVYVLQIRTASKTYSVKLELH